MRKLRFRSVEMRRISASVDAVAADHGFASKARDEGLAPERAHDHQGVRCEDRSRLPPDEARVGKIVDVMHRANEGGDQALFLQRRKRVGADPVMGVIEIEAAVLGDPKPAEVIVDALLDHVSGLARRGLDGKGDCAHNGACGRSRTPWRPARAAQSGRRASSSASLRFIAWTTPPRGRVECVSMATRSGRLMRLAPPRRTPSAAPRQSREEGRSGPPIAA